MTDHLLQWMKEEGIPITREKYLGLAWGEDLPDPWTPEHEAELPEELQDVVLTDAGFDPSQPRDPEGKWSETGAGGGTGYEFVSPNVGQGGINEAIKELKGERQRNLHTAAKEIDRGLNIDGEHFSAIGAWADGAENTTVSTVLGDTWDKIKVSAAMKAHLADQKSALVFKQEDGGKSVLYTIHVNQLSLNAEELHKNLLADGLAFHTIVPSPEGDPTGTVQIYVADLDGSAHDAVAKAAERYDAKVSYQFGKAEFIGTTKEDGTDREQRDDARRAYEEIVEQSPVSGSQDVWARVRDHWGKTLGITPPGEVNPAVVEVGGDAWNKATALRLEQEYAAKKPVLDKLVNDIVAGATPEVSLNTPESWGELNDENQELVAEKYKEHEFQSVLDGEIENWSSGGDALTEAKIDIANMYYNGVQKWHPEDKLSQIPTNIEWATDKLDELREERREDGLLEIPYTNAQLIKAMTVEFDPDWGSGGKEDPSIAFDDKLLGQPTDLQYEPERQMAFAGIPPATGASHLNVEMRTHIIKVMKEAFNKQAEEHESDIEPPEHLHESAKESVEMFWEEMSDSDKYHWAKENTDVIEEPVSDETAVEIPAKFDPMGSPNASVRGYNYVKTQALARRLSVERAAQLLIERNVAVGHPPTKSFSTLPVAEAHEAARFMDRELWSDWKSSSTSTGGQILQLAIHDELGGRLQESRFNREAMVQAADAQYTGGYEAIKAYVRAKWETTQYLLDKANMHVLDLYRGLRSMPIATEPMEPYQGFLKLPKASIYRNGASSMTLDKEIAQNFSGSHDDSVVIRVQVPRTAIVSVPAYGQNIFGEREVVVAGTAWKGWDAWARGRAPEASELKIAA